MIRTRSIIFAYMGSGISIDSCIDGFNASRNDNNCETTATKPNTTLTEDLKIELKNLAEKVFTSDHITLGEVSQRLDQLKRDMANSTIVKDESAKEIKEEFLKYLTIQVMQRMTKRAVEDVFNELLSKGVGNDLHGSVLEVEDLQQKK